MKNRWVKPKLLQLAVKKTANGEIKGNDGQGGGKGEESRNIILPS